MGQELGRISGVMLKDNLERLGIDLTIDTDLLKLDVNNTSISINSLATDADTALFVNSAIKTTGLQVDTRLKLDSIDITTSNNTILSKGGDLYLSSTNSIITDNIRTDDLNFDDNTISSTSSNQSIEIRPDGIGEVNLSSTLNVTGNLHASGDILIEGTVVFGDTTDANIEKVEINAAINSDLIPSENELFSLGSEELRWLVVYPNLLNGQSITAASVGANSIDLTLRQGNTWYVSQNGSDLNYGNHEASTFRTIKHALENGGVAGIKPGDTVMIYPGTYEEITPLIIPQGVSIRGTSLRSVTVTADPATISNNVFELNGETTVSDLTVTNFRYNAVNDTGYAFSFADNFEVTSRSPYIQNVSVITSGSITTVADPRGFASGDAGKGALVDGAKALPTSKEATMLFHSVTFITPGVDALTMRNGVRIEWLNSFVYFANIAMYATAGSSAFANQAPTAQVITGGTPGETWAAPRTLTPIGTSNGKPVYTYFDETLEWTGAFWKYWNSSIGSAAWYQSTDNTTYPWQAQNWTAVGLAAPAPTFSSFPTLKFGAEVRSIGSACVYGNYGAWAEGQGTLMYLINHNFGYIGAGKDVSNDPSLQITDNEVTMLDTGKIYFQSVDNKGNFTVGDPFTVSFETGTASIGGFGVTATGISSILFGSETSDTVVNSDIVSTGNIKFSGNTLTSITGPVNLLPSVDKVNLTFNVSAKQNILINNDFSLKGVLTLGNQLIDMAEFNAPTDSDILPAVDRKYSFGGDYILTGFGAPQLIPYKRWNKVINQVSLIDGNIRLSDNVIQSTLSNADLELRTNGTGAITLETNNLIIDNQLTVDGTSTTSNIGITGFLHQTGNTSQIGDRSISNSADITGNVSATVQANIETISISQGLITTNASNADLELRAAGTGEVIIPTSDVLIQNNLTVNGLMTAGDAIVTNQVASTQFDSPDISFYSNTITTTGLDQNLIIGANGVGTVITETSDVTFGQGLQVDGLSTLGNVVTVGDTVHNGTFNLTGDLTQTGNYILSNNLTVSLTAHFDNINIDNNVITTVDSNSDLELRAAGSGIVNINDNFRITNDATVTGITATNGLTNSGTITSDKFSDGNILITENYITTTTGDLTLSPNLNGKVSVAANNVLIDNDLQVEGTSTLGNTVVGKTLTTQVNQNLSGTSDPTGFFYYGWQILNPGQTVPTFSVIQPGWTVVGQPTWVVTTVGDGVTNYDITITGGSFASGGTYSFTGPDLSTLTVTGTINRTGNTTETGNYTLLTNLSVSGTASLTNIDIDNNVITTSDSNSDLELRASGTGQIIINDVFRIVQAAQIETLVTAGIANSATVTSDIFTNGTILIKDNYFTTVNGNTDLVLQAPAIKNVYLPFDPLLIDNDLTVVNTTSIRNSVINGDILHTGNILQTGNVVQTGDKSISTNLTVNGTTALFPDISIIDNVIKTLSTNSDLELRAVGSGVIRAANDNVAITQQLTVNGTTATSTINNSGSMYSDQFTNGDILVKDNFITTTSGTTNLRLLGNGLGGPRLEKIKFNANVISTESLNDNIVLTVSNNSLLITGTNALKIPVGTASAIVSNNTGDIRLDTTDSLFSGWNGARVTFGGLYSTSRLTQVSAHPTNNTIDFVTNSVTAMTLTETGITPNALLVNNNLFFNNNTISATSLNSNVFLSPNGTGSLTIENIEIQENTITNLKSTAPLVLQNTGFGYVAFGGTGGIAIPAGPTISAPPGTELGDFRFNTTLSTAEIFNGIEYVSLSGGSGSGLLTADEIQEITNLWGIILG